MGSEQMHVAGNWRLQGERYNLLGQRCPKCGKISLVGRGVCECSENKLENNNGKTDQVELPIRAFYYADERVAAK